MLSQTMQGDLALAEAFDRYTEARERPAQNFSRVVVFGYQQCLKGHTALLSPIFSTSLLRPPRSHWAPCFCRRSGSLRSRCFGCHRIRLAGFFVHFRQDDVVIFFVLCQQRRYLPQFFRSLLQGFDLLGELCVLRLLTPQDLMDVLHTTP